jgi:hypothetical protein
MHLFIDRISLYAKDDYASVVFKFPRSIETKSVKLEPSESGLPDKHFPLVLNIKTMTLSERQTQILKANPLMYVPKSLI